MTATQRLVVIGNGMAGAARSRNCSRARPRRYAIDDLRRRAAGELQPDHALAGAGRREELRRHRHQRRRLVRATTASTLIAGEPVDAIDRDAPRRCVPRTARSSRYDKLLIATGSDPFIIPVPASDLPGVVTFRDLDDVDAMLARGAAGRRRRW